jgi:hypothetical protein
MANDLYGELLARALQRQAPPGHFPAYGGGAGSSSVMHNGREIPRSFGQGQHYVELAYLTPAEQTFLGQVDMYDSNPPHTGPAGIPNFNGGAGGGGGGGGDGDGDGGMEDAIAQGMMAAAVAEDAQAAANAAAATAAAESSIAEQDAIDLAQAQDAAAAAAANAAAAVQAENDAAAAAQAQAATQAAAAAQAQNAVALAETRAARSVAQAGGGPQTAEEATGTDIGVSVDPGFGSLGVPVDMEDVIGQGMVGVDVPAAAIAAQAVADAQAEAATTAAGTSTANALANALANAQAVAVAAPVDTTPGGGGTLAPGDFGTLSAPSMPAQATPVTDDAMANAIAEGMIDVDVPTGVGVAHDAQGQSIEQQLAEILQTTPYPTQVDVGHVDQAKAQEALNAQVQATGIMMESGFGTGTNIAADEATQAAIAATGQDPTAGNVDHMGELTEQGLTAIAQDIGTKPKRGGSSIAQGRGSPGAMWGANSEVAQNNIDAGRSSGITPGMIATLNAQDHQGYAINNPQPTEASLQASLVFAELNPTVTNAIIGVMGLMPGSIGFASFLVGLITNKGLLNIPAVRALPGMQTFTDIVNIPQDLIGRLISGITDPIGDFLSPATEHLADILSRGEPTEFEDADEDYGGEPEIEFVPPTAAEADAEPAPPARTFKEVDEATRNRILANILGGLRRTGRSTEGVTAFGPLFT